MKITLSNDTVGMAILLLLIPLLVGVCSYRKRRNGLLAFVVGIFTFSICHMVGEFILPIQFYYEPDTYFTLESGVRFLYFDEYLWEMLMEKMGVLCYFLLFAFSLRCLFRPMRKIRKWLLTVAIVFVGIVGYGLLRNLLYGTVVAHLDCYSIAMGLAGALVGYLLSIMMEKFCPAIYKKMSLAESPKDERKVSYMVDLE